MKLRNLFFAATVLSISINCSNKAGLGPTSSESDALNKVTEGFLGDSFSHHHKNALLNLLNLTDEQKMQIKEIMQSRHELLSRKGHFKEKASFEDRKAKRKEAHEAVKNEIYAVLTSDQQAKLDQLKSQLESGEAPRELIELHIKELDTKLRLSAEQKNQIQALDSWGELFHRHRTQENRRGFFIERREIHEAHDEQISNLLTPEQKEIFKRMKSERKDQMGDRRRKSRDIRSEHRSEKLAEALDLNEMQKGQVEQIFANAHTGIRGELDGKQSGRNREEQRQAMHSRMKEIHQQIENILTPEQKIEFGALIEERAKKVRE